MFFSLNKKVIYTIAAFFIAISIIFLYSFYIAYGNKIQNEQINIFQRNQQYLEMLYENINLRKRLSQIDSHELVNIRQREAELSNEKKLTETAIRNYDIRYETIKDGIMIILFSAALISFLMIILGILIRRLVIIPINTLAEISQKISEGDLSLRAPVASDKQTHDELDILSSVFNEMISNIENNTIETKRREKFLQSLIDSIPDGICVLRPDGTIAVANKEYYRQINTRKGRSQHKCYALNHRRNDMCTDLSCPIKEIIHNGQSNFRGVQQFSNTPGHHFSINAAPLHITNNNGQKETLVVTSIRDLSDDIRFSHQQKLFSLGFLATSVAHEMKNHLGSIRMIVEGMLDKFYPGRKKSEEKKYLQMIDKQLIECIDVPERLLKLARNNSQTMSPTNCAENINDVISLLDYEAKRRGIIVKTRYEDSNISILGNDTDFKMVLINLIQNAFHAMDDNGKLDISVRRENKKHIAITVSDNGKGIPPANLPHIFEPFFSDGHNSPDKGNGLGLTIVKSVVESFGGTITVKSTPGSGTTFTMTFPQIKA